jgi:hypothetical protein
MGTSRQSSTESDPGETPGGAGMKNLVSVKHLLSNNPTSKSYRQLRYLVRSNVQHQILTATNTKIPTYTITNIIYTTISSK